MSSRKAALIGWLALATLPLGCDASPSAEQVSAETRLKGVAAFYGRYQASHRGQPPKTEEDFKTYLASLGSEEFATFGATGANDLLTSPLDGKPFVIRYGVNPGPPQSDGSSPVIAHETIADGKPGLGVTMLGQVRELDAPPGP